MSATLETLFGVQNLRSVSRMFFGEARRDTLFQDLFKSSMSRQFGEQVDLDQISASRTRAPFGSVEAASIARGLLGRTAKKAPWLEIVVNKTIKLQPLIDQHYPGGNVLADGAAQKLADEVEDLLGQIVRSIEYVCAQVLMNQSGATINSTTVPGSEISDTLDWAINDLDATTAWSTLSTDILSVEIPIIRDDMISDAGYDPGIAIYAGGSTGAERYLMQNTELADLYAISPQSIALLNSGQLSALGGPMGGIGGIREWIRYDGRYDDGTGTITKYITGDFILFLPQRAFLPDVLGFAEGYVAVPSSAEANVIGSAPSDVQRETGISMYSVLLSDPWAVKVVASYRFLPIVKDVNAALLFDTTP